MKGWMYILECGNGAYYTGSTKYLELRLQRHQNGEGANFTRKHLPVKLVYYEEYDRIDEAFYREKQVQGWSRKKKEALIAGAFDRLRHLSRNYTQYGTSTGSVPEPTGSVPEPTGTVPEPAGSVPEPTGSVPEPTGSVPEPTGSVPEPLRVEPLQHPK